MIGKQRERIEGVLQDGAARTAADAVGAAALRRAPDATIVRAAMRAA
jgi:hypothetical protein